MDKVTIKSGKVFFQQTEKEKKPKHEKQAERLTAKIKDVLKNKRSEKRSVVADTANNSDTDYSNIANPLHDITDSGDGGVCKVHSTTVLQTEKQADKVLEDLIKSAKDIDLVY